MLTPFSGSFSFGAFGASGELLALFISLGGEVEVVDVLMLFVCQEGKEDFVGGVQGAGGA